MSFGFKDSRHTTQFWVKITNVIIHIWALTKTYVLFRNIVTYYICIILLAFILDLTYWEINQLSTPSVPRQDTYQK